MSKAVTRKLSYFGNKIAKEQAKLAKLEAEVEQTKKRISLLIEKNFKQSEQNLRQEVEETIESTNKSAININNSNDEIRVTESTLHLNENVVMLDNVVEIEKQNEKSKRIYNNRPTNWTDIAHHFNVHKNLDLTINVYDLLNLNSNFSSWQTILRRWGKELIDGKIETKRKSRKSVIGDDIDNELAEVVENYIKSGIPVTNLILKVSLQNLLTKHNRHDLLERMNPLDQRNIPGSSWFIRIGDGWCHRFYNRHGIQRESENSGRKKARKE